jgi:peroxisomal 3,2-trans-enoyl-CoA isomerase
VVGISAALIAHSDFIYVMPHAYLLAPFSSLGLVAEGGSSRAFVQRMGISKANEALLMSKRISAEEMLQCGFVNRIFDMEGSAEKFVEAVIAEIRERLGENLNRESVLKIKALIRGPEREALDGQVMKEILGGVERMMSGQPQQEFARMAAGQKKHKL